MASFIILQLLPGSFVIMQLSSKYSAVNLWFISSSCVIGILWLIGGSYIVHM